MSAKPPSWAMGAVGIDGTGDSHIVEGVHLRVLTGAAIGLPIRPFAVYRLDREAAKLLSDLMRDDITWVDSGGRVLSLPFEVTRDNQVTGYFNRPSGVRAIAGGIEAAKARQPANKRVIRPGPIEAATAPLVVDAFIDTPQGRRLIGRRDQAPYSLAAPDIHGLVVSGDGTVRSGFWIEADISLVERLKPIFLLDLPVPAATRYTGLPDAEARAEKRVRRGAPKRFGLHDDPSVAGPASAALATDDDEWYRVETLANELMPYLDQALNDTANSQQELRLAQVLDSGVVAAHAQADIASLQAVLAGAADPGVAKWLGYMGVDEDPAALQASATLYFIRGFFAFDLGKLDFVQLHQINASGGKLAAPITSSSLPYTVPDKSKDGLPVYDFTVPLVVFPGAPPLRPGAPVVGSQLAPAAQVGPKGTQPPKTADGQGPWLAEFVPPEARREVILPLSGLTAAPTLAAARQDGSGLLRLNDAHPETGRALALIPAVPSNATATGGGTIADRTVPPEAVSYRVAQADWFGRWSGFGTRAVPAKGRALPPAPVFNVHYLLADAEPIDDTPRFGTLTVRLLVPRDEDLAPGSRLLVSGRVEAVINGVSVNASALVSGATDGHLEIEVPPPAGIITRAGQATAIINARWSDGVNLGPLGDPQQHTLADPRPPAAVAMDSTLRYSARPDAVGRARVVLDWPAAAGVRYRVYSTDETRLRGALQDKANDGNGAAAALLAELDAAPSPAHRAIAYTQPNRAGLYDRGLFTNLTAQALAGDAGSELRFSHDLSGSLSVLAFYKVVALSEANVESPFTDATLIPVAVPSGGPPPRPLLDFLGFTEAGSARFRVTTVRGPQSAVRWRLRRSFAESSDALRMPIVAEGPAPEAPDDGPAIFEVEDAGTDSFAGGSLRPWTRTSWRVEVQSPNPPGSTLPGEWSPASGPAGGMHIPPAPVEPTGLAIDSTTATSVRLTWKHPDSLQKGSQGGYRFDIYRCPAGGKETLAGSVLADDPTVVSGAGAARTFAFTDAGDAPVGTTWRVVVLDPAGRLSLPSNLVTRS